MIGVSWSLALAAGPSMAEWVHDAFGHGVPVAMEAGRCGDRPLPVDTPGTQEGVARLVESARASGRVIRLVQMGRLPVVIEGDLTGCEGAGEVLLDRSVEVSARTATLSEHMADLVRALGEGSESVDLFPIPSMETYEMPDFRGTARTRLIALLNPPDAAHRTSYTLEWVESTQRWLLRPRVVWPVYGAPNEESPDGPWDGTFPPAARMVDMANRPPPMPPRVREGSQP